MKIKKEHIYVPILIAVFVAWGISLYFFSPTTIVEKVGVHNAYLIVFLTCVLGGMSILFPIPYYLTVFTFAAGGANPWLIGICAGLGIAVGDSTSYFVGYKGSEIIPKKYQKISSKVVGELKKAPGWARFTILLVWGVMAPLPNDLLLIPLGVLKYPYSQTVVPLVIGSIIFNTIIAFSAIYGFMFFF